MIMIMIIKSYIVISFMDKFEHQLTLVVWLKKKNFIIVKKNFENNKLPRNCNDNFIIIFSPIPMIMSNDNDDYC